MNSIDLNKHLEKNDILPLYYLSGNETYLIDEAVAHIEDKVLSPDHKAFNYEVFYGGNDKVSQIITAARTMPILSKKRLVIVKDANKLSPDDIKEFTSYVEKPSPCACLVFVGEKVDSRKKFFTKIEKSGIIAKLNHPNERELPYWVRRLAEKFHKKIGHDTARLLIEVVGNNLQEIHNEIEKVSIYVGERKTIRTEDIEAVVTGLKVENIFRLIDSVGNKETEKALKILENMLSSGEEHLRILAMIIYRFRLLLRTKELTLKGTAPHEMAKRLQVRDFLLKGLIKQSNRFSLDELKESFGLFYHTDLTLKSSRVSKKLILERLILDLCAHSAHP